MALRFWVGGAGTWDNSTTTHWSATTGGAGGVSVPGTADSVTFDGASGGGVVTVAAAINGSNTVVSLTAGLFTGTLDFSVNNPTISAATFSWTGGATRSFLFGTSVFNPTSAGGSTPWDLTTITGLTFTGAPSINLAALASGARTFSGGGQSYGSLTVSDSGSTGDSVTIGGNNTFGTFTVTGPVNMVFNSGTTQTVTGAFSANGTAFNSGILLTGSGTSTTAALSIGAGSIINWAAIKNMVFSGTAITATNSFDLKGTSGITITGPGGGKSIVGC